jgi:hypothetical protein
VGKGLKKLISKAAFIKDVKERKKKKRGKMVRWYDWIAAVVYAYLIMYFFFTIPIFGAIIAYMIYEYLWGHVYCQYRLQQENR